MVTIVSKLSRSITALLETWIYLYSTCRQRYREVSMVRCVTYGGPVFSHKPQVVSEEWKNADAEHGRHKKEKQDMEFGVRLWQVTLGEGEREKGELWDKDQQPTRHGQQVTLTQLDRNVRVTGLRWQKTVNVTHCANTDTFTKHCEGLPLDNSLPISSGKA